MSPRATVAIAFYNEERDLGDAIRSILGQTMNDFELLLLDDGSTDGSLAIARAFASDPRVRIAGGGRRSHLAARLNEAVALARGELFARMDADDLSHPERLARQIAILDREPRCTAVGTWAALVDAEERPFGVIASNPAAATPMSVVAQGMIPHATMVARTDWLRRFPYDETLTRAEDRDLWCRTFAMSRFAVVPEVHYVVRVLAGAAGFSTDYQRGQSDLRRVLRRHGPSIIGRARTARLVTASFAKSTTMHVLSKIGWAERIVLRRGRALSLEERRQVAVTFAAVRAQTP